MTSDDKPQKKPYHAPVIEVYGNLAEITKTIGTMGRRDKFGPGTNKTA